MVREERGHLLFSIAIRGGGVDVVYPLSEGEVENFICEWLFAASKSSRSKDKSAREVTSASKLKLRDHLLNNINDNRP